MYVVHMNTVRRLVLAYFSIRQQLLRKPTTFRPQVTLASKSLKKNLKSVAGIVTRYHMSISCLARLPELFGLSEVEEIRHVHL